MHLTEDVARRIISLNPNPELEIIDRDVAERQFQVIIKGFNHLVQPENNFLYIADEVGLGKTYIAIGIASLLRHFSNNPENYNDVIIVPKKNLQFKWQKEIHNFIEKNYLRNDAVVKSVINKPAANLSKEGIKHHLTIFQKGQPNYVIYRNSSFSLASDTDIESKKWMEKLKCNLPDHNRVLFEQICKEFKRDSIIIKRAYAYLLNQSLPDVDLLIVDEAHNFKHGIEGDVSVRNQVVSRIFGACKSDDELFEVFPSLRDNSHPRVNKLIFLSATPINTQLIEIKRELDCFLSNHIFMNKGNEIETESYINSNLNTFLIRGLMTIKVNNKAYSRNSYRHEHRFGNVMMFEDAKPQFLTDNRTALVLCLMQYKTIKELKQKSNNQFEMGMLAGFESFEDNVSKYEEDTLENRKQNEAKDEHIIRSIVDSYYKEFSNYPPHPKQDSLVEEVFSLMCLRQKSLIFVRRIASVRELERKLYKKYSDYILDKIRNIKNYTKFPPLKELIKKSELEKNRDDIERIIDLLAERVAPYLKNEHPNYMSDDFSLIQIIGADLRELFNTFIDNKEIETFKNEINSHIHRKTISSILREISVILLNNLWKKKLVLDNEIEDESSPIGENELDEEKSPYFFQRFFYNEGKKFKNRIYKKDWFELNLLLINDKFNFFQIDCYHLAKTPEFGDDLSDFGKFAKLREFTIQALRSNSKNNDIISQEYRTNTFLTELLLSLAESSFSIWVGNHYKKDESSTRFIEDLDLLNEILRSIFRQGSGLIPTFIADALSSKQENPRESFMIEMKNLLLMDFNFVLEEIIQVLLDFDKIIDKNFNDRNKIRFNLIQQLPVLGVSGQHRRDVQKSAIQFRMPGYPYVLIATDILKEGEDLHSYCKNIYHYGIAWNPSDMEQRTGRIDRIDSMAYRKIKEIADKNVSSIPFLNKLQVFYPYLADTLEVNQMCKLFEGMDKFINIFYNDLSVKIDKDSKARVDQIVNSILPQRDGLLESKYDVHNFLENWKKDQPIYPKEHHGATLEELQNEISRIYQKMLDLIYHSQPDLDLQQLKITGVLNIRNNRQGPFCLYVDHTFQLGEFEYLLESCLGRVNLFGTNVIKQKIDSFLKQNPINGCLIEPIERNSFIWLKSKAGIKEDSDSILQKILDLVHITDELEEKLSNKDEKVDTFN
jgi:hypothetical protein